MANILDIETSDRIIRERDGVRVGEITGECPVALGDTYTTTKSGVTGVVREIVKNPTNTWRVRLETATGEDRWTTVAP